MNQYLKDDVTSVIMEVEINRCSRKRVGCVHVCSGRSMVVGLIEGYKDERY